VTSSFSAGLLHVEALSQLVVVAKQLDPASPWTLLRGAVENFRLPSGFSTARKDLSDVIAPLSVGRGLPHRAQHEADVNHVVTGANEKTGLQRQQEVKPLADSLAIKGLGPPRTHAAALPVRRCAGLGCWAVVE
jgi:hypothetical protein